MKRQESPLIYDGEYIKAIFKPSKNPQIQPQILWFEDCKMLTATASATLIPSIPADRIPPAYPAPSPAG
jgi:hypothetical protein